MQGKDFAGRGIDSDEKTAFDKACAEAIERAICWTLKAPAAMAAFPDEEGARSRAYYELVGIDRAICHHFCRQRLHPCSFGTLGKSIPAANIQKMAAANRLEINLFELRPVADARVISAIAWSKDPRHPVKGFVAGFGTGPSQENAALSAVLECLRTAAAVFIGGAGPEEPLNSLAGTDRREYAASPGTLAPAEPGSGTRLETRGDMYKRCDVQAAIRALHVI